MNMQCDLCGSEEKLYKARIEGTELNVCKGCAAHGVVLGEVKEPAEEVVEKKKVIVKEPAEEVIQVIASDFSEKIRRKREELGLNQEDFAKKISEKESVVHKLETGELEPSISLAERLEKMFGIKLVEEYKEARGAIGKGKAEEVTIGDMIKIKRRAR
jgi:uncharacterized protein (TIGR00270 family)